MAFNRDRLSGNIASSGENRVFYYNTDDGLDDLAIDGYFNEASDVLLDGSLLTIVSHAAGESAGLFVIRKIGDNIHLETSQAYASIDMLIAGANPTDAEIRSVVGTPATFSIFYGYDSSAGGGGEKVFIITYSKSLDIFFYEKLTPAA